MKKYKIVVFVPVANADAIRQALGNAGAGRMGKYTFATFSTRGTGRFLPMEGAKPAIGHVGKMEEVDEERIFFLLIVVQRSEEPVGQGLTTRALEDLRRQNLFALLDRAQSLSRKRNTSEQYQDQD